MGTHRLGWEEGEQTSWEVKNPTWLLFLGERNVGFLLVLAALHGAKMRLVGSWGDKTPPASHDSIGLNRKPWDLLLKGHPSKQELMEFPLEQQWMGNASDPGMEMWSHGELRGGLFPGLGVEMLSWYN